MSIRYKEEPTQTEKEVTMRSCGSKSTPINKEVINYVKKLYKDGCPFCGGNTLTVLEYIHVMSLHVNTNMPSLTSDMINNGDTYMHVLPVVCNDCGRVDFLHVGLISRKLGLNNTNLLP